MSQPGIRLPSDWYDGTLPTNVEIDATAYIESAYSFVKYRSEQRPGVKLESGSSIYQSTMFDVGPKGQVTVGSHALVNGARIICDQAITIGDYALISWNVVIMDTYRLPFNSVERRRAITRLHTEFPAPANVPAAPIHIGRNVWIGFDCCVLPGVTIGEGSIVGARSVVAENVPPYTVVGGNPARVIRQIAH